jgi:hypothetical protein
MNPADQHEDSSHNGSSGFGDNADSAEMADLGRVLIDARIAEQRARYKSSFRAIEETIRNKPSLKRASRCAVRHAVRFPLRHILCNRLTCSLMCSCRNPFAVTFARPSLSRNHRVMHRLL